MQKIKEWARTPAAWHEFWMPQSGAIGGVMLGLIIWLYANIFYDVFLSDVTP